MSEANKWESKEAVRLMTPGEMRVARAIMAELSKLPFDEAISVITNTLVNAARGSEMPKSILLKCISETWDGQARIELSQHSNPGVTS